MTDQTTRQLLLAAQEAVHRIGRIPMDIAAKLMARGFLVDQLETRFAAMAQG